LKLAVYILLAGLILAGMCYSFSLLAGYITDRDAARNLCDSRDVMMDTPDAAFKEFWNEPDLKLTVMCPDMMTYWKVNDTWIKKGHG
jgi:hypothetical protein